MLAPVRLDRRTRSVRGSVRDDQQRPVPGALVCGSDTARPAYADEDGLFELKGLPPQGKVWLVAVHPEKTLFAITDLDADWDHEAQLLLQPLGSATGQVVDEAGAPIARAKVALQLGPTREYEVRVMGAPRDTSFKHWRSPELLQRLNQVNADWLAVADAEGRWTAGGLVGGFDYRVIVYRPESSMGTLDTRFTAQPGGTVDVGQSVVEQ